ncbi:MULTISPECIES: hypothetical protein [Serratia]|nr:MULTISPECIES: hypothetical protein [Serratia]UTN99285.1 hypothetical protein NLX81_05640 [Serratia plymuthica]
MTKLSNTTTSSPRSNSASTVCEPMYPAPPVTKIAIMLPFHQHRALTPDA